MFTSSLAKNTASLLTAGLLALSLACGGAGAHATDAAFRGTSAPSGTPASPPPAVPAAEPETAAATPSEAAAPAAPARNSPIQALNQMVTAQALLVSLLLAPLSKDAGGGPQARADAAPASPPTR
jgi:hypothetical protein